MNYKTTDMTIWKFELEIKDKQSLEIPLGSVILDAQVQHGKIFLWATVDPLREKETRDFAVIGTGWYIDTNHKGSPVGFNHIATVQLHGGDYVFHVFEYDYVGM